MNSEKKIFFNGLNELRAFAALAVLFHHAELFKRKRAVVNLFDSDFFYHFISRLGKNGVYLFFVLSGFLITYLLLKEKEKHQTILFKKFYLRRIFRIWPLYYIIVLIGFVIMPFLAHTFDIFQRVPHYFILISNPENYALDSLLMYLFFLPNLALSMLKSVPGCTQSWSVGVEEQFYLLWPLLVFVFSRKQLYKVFLLLIFVFVFSQICFQPALQDRWTNLLTFEAPIIHLMYKIVNIIPFEFMAIGAIGGYLYAYHKDKIISVTKNRMVYLAVIFSVLLFLFVPVFSKYLQNVFLSVLFLVLILFTINDANSSVFRNKYFSYLGSISYGIYMYHPFVLFLVFSCANSYLQNNLLTYNLFVYVFALGLTIALSHLSYKYIELRFIKYKDKKYSTLGYQSVPVSENITQNEVVV